MPKAFFCNQKIFMGNSKGQPLIEKLTRLQRVTMTNPRSGVVEKKLNSRSCSLAICAPNIKMKKFGYFVGTSEFRNETM